MPHLKKKAFLYNAASHVSVIATVEILEFGFELVNRPPYLPNLAQNGTFLRPNLKVWLGEQRFLEKCRRHIVHECYFKEKDSKYYLDGLKRWEHR